MRMWPRSEGIEDDNGVVDPPADIAGIMAYSMADGQVPEGVTIPAGETISSRRIEDVRVREPGEEWGAL